MSLVDVMTSAETHIELTRYLWAAGAKGKIEFWDFPRCFFLPLPCPCWHGSSLLWHKSSALSSHIYLHMLLEIINLFVVINFRSPRLRALFISPRWGSVPSWDWDFFAARADGAISDIFFEILIYFLTHRVRTRLVENDLICLNFISTLNSFHFSNLFLFFINFFYARTLLHFTTLKLSWWIWKLSGDDEKLKLK